MSKYPVPMRLRDGTYHLIARNQSPASMQAIEGSQGWARLEKKGLVLFTPDGTPFALLPARPFEIGEAGLGVVSVFEDGQASPYLMRKTQERLLLSDFSNQELSLFNTRHRGWASEFDAGLIAA